MFADELNKGVVGFGEKSGLIEETKTKLLEKLKDRFSPELINRLDKICLFNPLTQKHLEEIAKLQIEIFNQRLKNHKTKITAPTKILTWVVNQLKPQSQNARELRSLLESQVEELLTEIILNGKTKKQYELKIKNEKLTVV